MSKFIIAIALILASCTPQPKRPPTPEPGNECAAACIRRVELSAECPTRTGFTSEECTEKCKQAEKLRPGVTHSTCVATSLTCQEMRDCADRP